MVEIEKDVILTALYEAGLAEDDIRWDYSGRGMYGQTCFGIVGSLLDYTGFLLQLASDTTGDRWDVAYDLSQRVNTDSMAMQTIFYFPGIKVTDG